MAFGYGTRYLTNMKPKVTIMLGSRSLKMSLLLFSMGITVEAYLNGSKIMKMPSQNLFAWIEGMG
jgi:hypothetical protein